MAISKFHLKVLAGAVALMLSGVSSAQESPPQSSPGVIEDPTLVANQDLAKAQAVGAITSFMTQGATQCDSDGSNCRSLFGADDNMDMSSMHLSTKGVTGVETFAFSGEDNSSNSVASQVGDFAIACGFTTPEVHSVSGIAVKVHDCTVNTAGNASARVQVCTAPARSLPIKNPENAIQCSTNPADPNYTAPNGFTCWVPACDDMPEGTLNGWSPVHDISFTASMSETASDSEKSNNGLALIFYPPLDGSQPKDFKTDSETMTAVKLLQSFVDTETKKTAVGFRVAYRYKSQVTKEMLSGASGAINPNDHSSQWETIEKLQGNALIPQYQKEFAANGSECLQQIQQGIASDGVVYVCDTQYTNESGIRPLEIKAQIAAEGQDCSSTTSCLKEVLNTNTWKEMCHSEAPLSLRKCTTTQDYTMESLSWIRTRTMEICTEKRARYEYGCTTEGIVEKINIKECPRGTQIVNNVQWTGPYTDPYMIFRVTCQGYNELFVQLGTSIGGYTFDTAPIYGSNFMVINQTVTMNAFESGNQNVGTACYGYGPSNNFDIRCEGLKCTYTIQVGYGGDCPFSNMAPRVTTTHELQFDPVYQVLNHCAVYENAI